MTYFIIVRIPDKLSNKECNQGASIVDSQGHIWVGTLGGMAILVPT